MLLPASLARTAIAELRRTQASAAAAIAARKISREQAELRCRDWLAMVCLAGADLPELTDALADYRCRNLAADGECAPFEVTEAEARVLVANRLSPPARRRATLARAAGLAIRDSMISDACHARAEALLALASGLGVTPDFIPDRQEQPA